MKVVRHVLISLEERHANNILAGTKQVELRRRKMHVAPGTTVWLYVKKPLGAVVGYAYAGETYTAAPSTVWSNYGCVSGISKAEFTDYFDGLAVASAMLLSGPRKLKQQISLDELRAQTLGFHPPQFYCRIEDESPIKTLLTSVASNAIRSPFCAR